MRLCGLMDPTGWMSTASQILNMRTEGGRGGGYHAEYPLLDKSFRWDGAITAKLHIKDIKEEDDEEEVFFLLLLLLPPKKKKKKNYGEKKQPLL